MWKDVIVEETRNLRAAYEDLVGKDPERIFDDICRRQEESGKMLVSFPPRKPKKTTRTA